MPSLRQIKIDPSLVDRRSGCCGFAAALMAMLVRDSDEVDELADCVTKGSKWRDIDKSTRVRDRLIKRMRVGIIPSNQPKCWTWGGERDFWAYMTDDRGFFPAYAIYLS